MDYTKSLEHPAGAAALNRLLEALHWTYNRSKDGVLGIPSSSGLAESYLSKSTTPERAISSLVRWQVAQASTIGFAANLGGLITLPIAIPADLVSTLFLQLRMVGAIAHLRGYETSSDQARTMAFVSLAGNGVAEVLKSAGIDAGKRMLGHVMERVSRPALIRINQTVGIRLLTKAGATGILNISKLVPVVGGVVGGTVDGMSTKLIASAAKRVFVRIEPNPTNTDMLSVNEAW